MWSQLWPDPGEKWDGLCTSPELIFKGYILKRTGLIQKFFDSELGFSAPSPVPHLSPTLPLLYPKPKSTLVKDTKIQGHSHQFSRELNLSNK